MANFFIVRYLFPNTNIYLKREKDSRARWGYLPFQFYYFNQQICKARALYSIHISCFFWSYAFSPAMHYDFLFSSQKYNIICFSKAKYNLHFPITSGSKFRNRYLLPDSSDSEVLIWEVSCQIEVPVKIKFHDPAGRWLTTLQIFNFWILNYHV